MTSISTSKSIKSGRSGYTGIGTKGFTLLEVVISLGIIATALLAIFQLQASNLDIQSEARFVTIAGQLAQMKMAEIEAMESVSEGTESGEFDEEFSNFAYATEIESVSDLEGFFKVKITVTRAQETTGSRLIVQSYIYRPEK